MDTNRSSTPMSGFEAAYGSAGDLVREKAEATGNVVREQAEKTEQASLRQSEKAERAAREQANREPARQADHKQARQAHKRARERYEGLTKAEPSDHLAKRSLPKTGISNASSKQADGHFRTKRELRA